MTALWPEPTPVLVRAGQVVLREWRHADVPVMVELFDTDEMNRRTPLASPFDDAAASSYVTAAHRARRQSGALQLAITFDEDGPPLARSWPFRRRTDVVSSWPTPSGLPTEDAAWPAALLRRCWT